MNTQPFLENAEDLYQNAPFGYMTVRADGLIVNVNATLLKWLGYEWEEILLQKSFQDLLDMGGKIYFETHMMPMLLMQGEISEINIELKGKASIKLPTLVNASRIHDQSALETYFRFSILDITQRKSYELELIKARQEAEQTIQRLKQINAELEQFASIASHDLQAPLRTISGLIGLSEKKGHFPVDSEVTKYFSLIKRNAQRMKLMIGDLLEYARIDSEELPFEEFSLNEACEIGLEMIDDQVKESNAVITIPELPMVIGNKLQLARLFQNLFGNSIKYRSESDPVIRVAFEEKNDEIRVFVKDNGMGFEEDLADQVFGFMKRLHSHDSIPGTGIGLSACKRILAIHGGTIGATSEPGKGSTFYFTLPR
ncbi:PAS domain S-box-containing protein [Algoriphagus alkaliphilus]|uniref:histidine kinase n=1 Tax=Algoriphagus alkaliphilus TaxID=279824 RepID=A0A1G5WLG1_9BACT|nr:ATP-binding protein [Algoriphagus alkaliphilus]SDA58754.1 PAS domain S-box-containing protein [Algoriphagus alkaliphilus]